MHEVCSLWVEASCRYAQLSCTASGETTKPPRLLSKSGRYCRCFARATCWRLMMEPEIRSPSHQHQTRVSLIGHGSHGLTGSCIASSCETKTPALYRSFAGAPRSYRALIASTRESGGRGGGRCGWSGGDLGEPGGERGGVQGEEGPRSGQKGGACGGARAGGGMGGRCDLGGCAGHGSGTAMGAEAMGAEATGAAAMGAAAMRALSVNARSAAATSAPAEAQTKETAAHCCRRSRARPR
jgi:hypothetical protein